MDFIKLVKAGRSLLDWSQEDLVTASGITRDTIVRLENGRGRPDQKTVDHIRHALERAGVEFTPDGVRLPDTRLTLLDQEDWFVGVLKDILVTCKPGDTLLIFGGNNEVSKTRPDVINGFRAIRTKGIAMREMVQEGNLYLMGREDEYRWIPSAHFHNYVTVIYADRVCTDFGSSGALLKNAQWAEAERAKFEMMWAACRKPEGKSIADIRF